MNRLAGSPPLTPEERDEVPVIEIGGREIVVRNLRPSMAYKAMLSERVPTAQTRWARDGLDFGSDWCQVYSLPFKVTESTKLQSLQFRILHRYFPTRRFLCIRKVIDDPFCENCGEIETITHLFMRCSLFRSADFLG